MKIAFVISSLYKGGAERVASILINAWEKEGHDVYVFLTSKPTSRTYEISEKIKVINITKKSRISSIPIFKSNALKKEFNRYNPDVVVSFLTTPSFYAAKAAKKCHIPFICSERSDPHKTKNIIYKCLRMITFKNANHIVFQGEYALKYFPKKIQCKSSIIINPCRVPTNLKQSTEKYIISAGRLERLKGFDLLIDAFSQIRDIIPDYKLKIFGNGSESHNLQSKINKLGLENKISLHPFSDKIFEEISKSSVFVLSSRYEGMPNTLCEALLLGVPCVATDCPIGLSRMLVKDKENGVICKNENSMNLAEGILEILNNYDFYKKNSTNNIKYYSSLLNPEIIANEWIKLANEVIEHYGK